MYKKKETNGIKFPLLSPFEIKVESNRKQIPEPAYIYALLSLSIPFSLEWNRNGNEKEQQSDDKVVITRCRLQGKDEYKSGKCKRKEKKRKARFYFVRFGAFSISRSHVTEFFTCDCA